MANIVSWDDLNLDQHILRGIYSCGFETPSPIQSVAIEPILKGKNIIAQAQSGTGKTATFTIGSLSLVDTMVHHEQVIVLSPTRELSRQIYTVFQNIGKFVNNLNIYMAIGGSPMWKELKYLRNNTPHVIIGCPGRVLDCITNKGISLSHLKLLVLDEADELLSSGFTDQLHSIISLLPNTTRVALFSATIPEHIRPVLNKIFTTPPLEILVKRDELTLEGISQYYVAMSEDAHKYEILKQIYNNISLMQGIIYCNSVRRVIMLYQNLINDGFAVSCIHGELDKSQREAAFEEFRTGGSRILISSNITARGIDIQQVNIVINYDIPRDVSSYIHRIGRSGRWGREGTGINFITREEVPYMRDIETYYDTVIEELPDKWYL
jgi:translation initiation factor 4A